MASVKKIGEKHRAQIRRAGHKPITKTFDSAKEANDWAILTEAALLKGENISITGTVGVTLGQAIQRYFDEIQINNQQTIDCLKRVSREIGHIALDKLKSEDLVNMISSRGYKPPSGLFEMAMIKSVLKAARIIWKYQVSDAHKEARESLVYQKIIGPSQERDRRPTDEEIKQLCAHFIKKAKRKKRDAPVDDVLRFCISSAMRISEVCRIEWADFNEKEKTIIIRDRKHPTKKIGNHKVVPLLDESIEIIKRQASKGNSKFVFPLVSENVTKWFTAATREIGIQDLHLHDLRHEGTSRLFEMGYAIHEVAMFTGHEDWRQLKRYTQLKAKDIRRLEPVKVEMETPVGMDEETVKEFQQFLQMKKMMSLMDQNKAA